VLSISRKIGTGGFAVVSSLQMIAKQAKTANALG
jgi:hypothetical protein